MHYYTFHIKDYRAKTAHLTPLEHYIYRTLIDWYYLNEKPFESVEQIARYLLLPLTDENRTAINAVLDEFFNYHKGKYHHSRINQEVKDYRHKNGNDKVTSGNATDNEKVTDDNAQANEKNNRNALSNSERQTRYKERKRMLKALSDKGVSVDNNADFWQVCEIFIAHFPPTDNEKLETVTESDNESNEQNNGKNGARTINQEPITINQYISPQTPQGAGVSDFNQAGKSDETTKTQTTKTQTTPTADKTLNVPFETFWDLYDKKINPKKCEPMWNKLSDKDRLAIMAYIPKYKQAQPDKTYRKHPQTFLGNRGWEDEIIDSQPPQPKSQPTWTPQPTQDIVDVQFGGNYQAYLRHQALQDQERFPQPLTPEEIERSRQAGLEVLSQFRVHKPQPAI